MIKAVNIHKKFGDLEVLKGVNLEVKQGEIISIVGSSGAGKTTFLQLLGTLDQANEGQILYDDVDITNLNTNKLAQFRNENIGFVFQFHHLLPEFTALENVCMPALIKGDSKKEAEQKARLLLEKVKIIDRKTQQTSGVSRSEEQKVAKARALNNKPKVNFGD